ncbi:grasp-with-spasm system ATP-grasp peptide maturase [Taibaiella koreensis]|uniref:grasp-with-spasm system ATP-grasp peptide maturase n=1 Tax=Taibaiella koreensis TaxID=1268548 RepID=UPI000E59FAD3|nr:grasp-with-spasm system ATP-grasp peptide maturase [Taibaiella koreensis]
MILIFSEVNDLSTLAVAGYLDDYGVPYTVVLKTDTLRYTDADKGTLYIGENKICLKDIHAVWFRRGKFFIRSNAFKDRELDLYLYENNVIIEDYVNYKLEQVKSIGSAAGLHVNKLIVLEKAKACGLTVPDYCLEHDFQQQDATYIVKGVNGNTHFNSDQLRIILPVVKLNDSHSSGLSFFQRYTEKKYELRIFYLHGRFWSMAIFSQNDPQTTTDFRKYNKERPNRNIPYTLPTAIEAKLTCLMESLSLNTGSIDMIVTPSLEHVFLEVNPVGQFGMVSLPCNYNLEKEIADFLKS